MKEEKRKIKLKEGQPKKLEIIIGNSAIKVSGSKPRSVPLSELQLWLDTGRFELVEEATEQSDTAKKKPEKKKDGGES